MSYAQNNAWKQINGLLPPDVRMPPENLPTEETWNWRGNAVHVERYANSRSDSKVILHHGVGTNARVLNLIYGHRLASRGYDVVALDNLGYGMTKVEQRDVTYADWVNLFVDFIEGEKRSAPSQKVILYGLSAGGMMAYHAACRTQVSGIIGMCFLRNDDRSVGEATARHPIVAKIGTPAAGLLSKSGLGRFPIAMKWVSKMHALVNEPKARRIFLKDPASAGGFVQQQFLHDYMTFPCMLTPEDFDVCPILLLQPEEDQWTPQELSERSLKGIKADFSIRVLQGAGHYPMEQPGLDQMIEYSDEFIRSIAHTG